MNHKIRILILDGIDPRGLGPLRENSHFSLTVSPKLPSDALKRKIASFEAVLVRSATRINAAILSSARKLRLIGRAGSGTDNIDVGESTRRGILVVNAAGANTLSACEHTWALLLALCRKLREADQRVRQGDFRREGLTGLELSGKSIGILGFGRVGREVARRAMSFGMKVLVYDPFVPKEQIRAAGAKPVTILEALRSSDILSLHLALNASTRGLINKKSLRLMKKGSILVNTSRGGIINENDLTQALKKGPLAAAGLDVFAQEPPMGSPLLKMENVILTPHIGASTDEAQGRVAEELGACVAQFFISGVVRNAVNASDLNPVLLAEIRPYLDLSERLGRFLAQIAAGPIRRLTVEFRGEISRIQTSRLLADCARGILSPRRPGLKDLPNLSFVNSLRECRQRGILIREKCFVESKGFTSLISVSTGSRNVEGTVIPGKGPQIVSIDGLAVDLPAKGRMLLLENQDRPGMIGAVGSLLGKYRINIADMRVGRKRSPSRPGAKAVMVFTVDGPVSSAALRELKRIAGISKAQMAILA